MSRVTKLPYTRLQRIKASWPYKNIQLVIIMGLVAGIALESTGVAPAIAHAMADKSTISYKAEVVQEECDQKCALNKWAHKRALELYAENKDTDLEKYRMEAISEGKNMLINILDESDFYDYEAMAEKYGY